MKKRLFLLFAVLLSGMASAQRVALKNNFLGDATLSPNLALEIGTGVHTTIDLYGSYNPFVLNNGTQFRHWLAQPELRFWFCERFNGAFLGIHGHVGEYNVAGIELPFKTFEELRTHRFEGYFYGGGISLGYQWVVGKRWGIEASLGGGYARIHYKKYECHGCSPVLEEADYNHFGLTRATVSLLFFFR